jgi:hypothetical protein
LGLKEMLADEITTDLRSIRTHAIAEWQHTHHAVESNHVFVIATSIGRFADSARFWFDDPGVALRFTPGFMLSAASRAGNDFVNGLGLRYASPQALCCRPLRGLGIIFVNGLGFRCDPREA